MSLSTLTQVKTALGVTDTSQDTFLTQLLSGGSAAIRRHCKRYLYGAIGAISAANPAVVTCPGHGLETGQIINVSGSNSSPVIDGAQTVTVIDQDTFSVRVDVTTAGTSGVFCRTYTEYYNGTGKAEFLLNHTPVQSIASLYFDAGGYYGDQSGGFASTTQLIEGQDFVLKRDNASETECCLSGSVIRITGIIWYRPTNKTQGLLTLSRGNPFGNIKVTYTAGYSRLLPDVMLAANQFVALLSRSAIDGTPQLSERYDYYQYQMLDPEKEVQALNSVKHLLAPYKKWSW